MTTFAKDMVNTLRQSKVAAFENGEISLAEMRTALSELAHNLPAIEAAEFEVIE